MKKNEKKFLKKITNGLCFLLIAGAMACSGESTTEVEEENELVEVEEPVVETWDNDEFSTTFASTDYYEEWDENDDSLLDENEYYGGFYDTWDTNNDNNLDENEWNTSVNDFGLENQTWANWDASGDGMLDENEFRTGIGESNYFADWDADDDNSLNEREYSDGLFGIWDNNDDNELDDNEYGYYNTYFGV